MNTLIIVLSILNFIGGFISILAIGAILDIIKNFLKQEFNKTIDDYKDFK